MVSEGWPWGGRARGGGGGGRWQAAARNDDTLRLWSVGLLLWRFERKGPFTNQSLLTSPKEPTITDLRRNPSPSPRPLRLGRTQVLPVSQ